MTKIILSANTDWYLYNFRLALAKDIQDTGSDVLMMSPSGPYVEKIRKAGLRWRKIRVTRQRVSPIRDLLTLRAFTNLYSSERPNLVHHFTVKPVIYGSLAARLIGIPATVNSVTGLGYPFVNPGIKAAAIRPLLIPLYRAALANPRSKAIFHNPQDRELFVSKRLVQSDQSLIIEGSGVNPDEFEFAPEPSGEPVVLMASRMLWDKGVAEFVKAGQILRERGARARFVLVGEPDPGYPDSVPENYLRSLKEEGVVDWLGHRDDMSDLLRQVHIVALPSYGEGLPRILLEASSTGRPVVASNIPGCRVVVRDGITGLLVPVRNAKALANALEALILDAKLRKRMGDAGRELVLSSFTQSQVNQKIMETYRDLLGGEFG